MSELKRYDCGCCNRDSCMSRVDGGDWVDYDDAMEAIEESKCKITDDELRRAIDYIKWYSRHENPEDRWAEVCSSPLESELRRRAGKVDK